MPELARRAAALLALAAAARAQAPPPFDMKLVAAGLNPTQVESCDMNGDGAADLVAAGAATIGGPSISVVLATAPGVFGNAKTFSLQSANVARMAIADVNGDGRLDALATAPPGKLVVLLGNGLGDLGAPASYAVASSVAALAVGDVDLDGRIDAACGSITPPFGYEIDLLKATGLGGFSPAAPVASGSGLAVIDVAMGLIDADALPDLLVGLRDASDLAPSALLVLRGNGAGGFTPLPTSPTGPPGLSDLALEDLNGDGAIDAVALLSPAVLPPGGSGFVCAPLGDGLGGFVSCAPIATASGQKAFTLAAGDLDRDGHPDVVAALSPYPGFSFLKGNGAGGLMAAVDLTPGNVGGPIAAVHLADVDADGRVDVITGASNSGKFVLVLNKSPGPASVGAFGAGTPGCEGALGVSANVDPHVGEASFAVVATNAPAHALGLG
ncbi:MAG TPA: VCBS repeat-containing protein, partial [Planctomycetota bacterium]|nr:VCBS repeat-containing protein [Planctomycetota bacterium]